ncbi:MAG: ORF6N domain-containing protein [Bacteroidota bacterium]|nr:ORF6N domain-containing protein [Bacteroidota bacterium]
MLKIEKSPILNQEAIIATKIFSLRDDKVILDAHLAELYDVETRVLKQAVRRNRDRFPEDFMYELTDEEIDTVVSQNVIPSRKHFGGATPYAFTGNGVAMLSSVLNSKRAVQVNIAVMRTFTMLRKMLLVNKDVVKEIEKIKRTVADQNQKILYIFDYLKQLEQSKQEELDQKNHKRVGFKRKGEQ